MLENSTMTLSRMGVQPPRIAPRLLSEGYGGEETFRELESAGLRGKLLEGRSSVPGVQVNRA